MYYFIIFEFANLKYFELWYSIQYQQAFNGSDFLCEIKR